MTSLRAHTRGPSRRCECDERWHAEHSGRGEGQREYSVPRGERERRSEKMLVIDVQSRASVVAFSP